MFVGELEDVRCRGRNWKSASWDMYCLLYVVRGKRYRGTVRYSCTKGSRSPTFGYLDRRGLGVTLAAIGRELDRRSFAIGSPSYTPRATSIRERQGRAVILPYDLLSRVRGGGRTRTRDPAAAASSPFASPWE